MTLTTPTLNEHAIVSPLGCHTSAQCPSSLPCQKLSPYKLRVVFSKPVYAARERIGPRSPNHSGLTGKPRSLYVHVTLRVTPPTSPYSTYSADAEPAHQCAETIFPAQCAVCCNQKCTIGFKGLINLKSNHHGTE